MHGAVVACGGVAELVLGNHADDKRNAGRESVGAGDDAEMSRKCRVHVNRGAAGDAAERNVGGDERLTARRDQRRAEDADAIGQRAVPRQRRRRIASAKRDRAAISRGDIVELILGGHCKGHDVVGGDAGRGGDDKMRGPRGVDGVGLATLRVNHVPQHANGIAKRSASNQIGFTISGKVRGCQSIRVRAHGESDLVLECAIAVAEKEAAGAIRVFIVVACNGQIGFAVTVHVRHNQSCWILGSCESSLVLECAIAVAEKHTYTGASLV